MPTCCTGGLCSFRGKAQGRHCPCSEPGPREEQWQGLRLAAPHPNTAASNVWGAWWQHGARGTCITWIPPPRCLQGSPRLGSALAPQRHPLQRFSCSAAAWAGLPSFAAFYWGEQNKALGQKVLVGCSPWCAGVPPWDGGDPRAGSVAPRLSACLGLSVVKCHGHIGLCMFANPPRILTLLLSGLQVRPAPGQCPVLPDPPLRGQHRHLQCTQGECLLGSPGMVLVGASCHGLGWFHQGLWHIPLDPMVTDQPRAHAESCHAGHCRRDGGAEHPLRHRELCLGTGNEGTQCQDQASNHPCSSLART